MERKKCNKTKIKIGFLLVLFITLFQISMIHRVNASEKQTGILIAKKDGTYTFYDLNQEVGNQIIERSKKKEIMIPLRKICFLLQEISYQFDFATKKATIINESTGCKMILQVDQKYGYLYAKGSAKGKKVTLSEKSYISKDSNAFMVHNSTLQYIFKKKTGYKKYDKEEIIKAGYDCNLFQEIIVYNQYKKVSKLPEAVKVNYVSEKIASNIVRVTIPEGFSIPQIVNRIVEQGVCISSNALYQAMEQVDYREYTMFDGRVCDETICFPLEGYLYPDTYEFYKNTSPDQVVAKILKHSQNKLSSVAEKAKQQGYTLDDVLKIASIIEKETGLKNEMAKISSVLHTRLKKNMKIQCDATIFYVEKYIKPFITGDIDRYNVYYNTYKCKALPAGAICSPGKNAIDAALHPSEIEYLYFASDDAGNYYYATDDEGWKEMSKLIKEKNEEYKKQKEMLDDNIDEAEGIE